MSKLDYSSLYSYIKSFCELNKNQHALIMRRKVRRETITYSQIPEILEKFLAWFEQEGIPVASKVLFWGTNCPEYALSLLACHCFGRVAVPIDWRNSQETILNIVEKTKPTFAFISKYFDDSFLKSKKIKVYYLEDLLIIIHKIASSNDVPNVDITKECEIVFTSGTTGLPKGVVITPKNLLSNLKALESTLPQFNNSRTISILPLSHMLEQVAGLYLPLSYGSTIYYLPRINSFKLLKAFQEYHPTHLVVVPQLLKILWGKIEDQAPSYFSKLLSVASYLPMALKRIVFKKIHDSFGGSLRFVACGGAPLDYRIGKNWGKIGIPVLEGYGATEVTAVASITNINNPQIGTVGKPLPGVNIKLMDKEVYIQSDSISSGYYLEPQKTAEAFTINGYKTGDIGEFDSQGNLKILGRDVFKIVLPSGEKVFVEDLEAKIYRHPAVLEACVVAKRLKDGDQIHAYFILKDNKVDLKKVVSNINGTLESKQQIISYDFWNQEDFPRTPTLKVDRKQVFQVANSEKSLESVANHSTGIKHTYTIMDVISRVCGFPKDRINDTDTLATDLEMDSLTRTELVSLAEEYLGISIDESHITSKTTVSEIKTMALQSEASMDVYIPKWQFSVFFKTLQEIVVKFILNPVHSLIISLKCTNSGEPKILPGSILLINHPGVLDLFCILRFLAKYSDLKIVFNAASDFWKAPSLFSKTLEFFGAVPLYQSGQRFNQLMQYESDLMDSGYKLVIAPQGGWQKSEEEEPFKPGVGYLVKVLQRPVTIIKIKDYYKIWPAPNKDLLECSLFELMPKRRGTARISFSEPIYIDWDTLTPIQITNYLEEEYKKL